MRLLWRLVHSTITYGCIVVVRCGCLVGVPAATRHKQVYRALEKWLSYRTGGDEMNYWLSRKENPMFSVGRVCMVQSMPLHQHVACTKTPGIFVFITKQRSSSVVTDIKRNTASFIHPSFLSWYLQVKTEPAGLSSCGGPWLERNFQRSSSRLTQGSLAEFMQELNNRTELLHKSYDVIPLDWFSSFLSCWVFKFWPKMVAVFSQRWFMNQVFGTIPTSKVDQQWLFITIHLWFLMVALSIGWMMGDYLA